VVCAMAWSARRWAVLRGVEVRWLLLGPARPDGLYEPRAGQRRSSSSCVLGELAGPPTVLGSRALERRLRLEVRAVWIRS
jgi:hypothetical protein